MFTMSTENRGVVIVGTVFFLACGRTPLEPMLASDSGATSPQGPARDMPAEDLATYPDVPADALRPLTDTRPETPLERPDSAASEAPYAAADGSPPTADSGRDLPGSGRDGPSSDAVDVLAETASDALDAKSDAPVDVRDSAALEVISREDASVDGPKDMQEVAGTGVDQARDGEGGDAFVCTRTLASQSLPMEPMGHHPMAMVLGDLNRDGKLDVVTANPLANSVSVLLGKGDGTFGPSTEYGTWPEPRSVALGDLNGDGNLDIVTADTRGNTASVFLGRGDGTFANEVDYATGEAPLSVALGDFNGDGKLDIVAANGNANTLSVLLGKGDGTFAAKVDYASGYYLETVAVGDLNRDGKMDILAGYSGAAPASLSVMLGRGDGTFYPRLDFTFGDAGSGARKIALGDLNGDGNLDAVLLVSGDSDSLSVVLGNGDGTFTEHGRLPYDSWPALELRDLDGDKQLDLILADGFAGTVSTLRGRGDGTFGEKVDYPTGRQVETLAVGDMNSDGKLDVVAAFYGSEGDMVGAVPGRGDGSFVGDMAFTTGDNPKSIALFDLDGDGNLDVVTPSYYDGAASVLLGRGNGAFAAKTNYPTGDGPSFVAVGDVTGDGRLDIVTANTTANTVSVLAGNGDGSFSAPVDYPTGLGPNWVALGDVNGDGRLDIVATSAEDSSPGVVSVLLAKAGGKFAAHVDYAVGAYPHSVALGDLNGDGNLDMVVVNWSVLGAGSMSVLMGKGDGSFRAAVDHTAGVDPNSVVLADLNGDGKLDIVAANYPSVVTVWLGNGDGTFAAMAGYSTGENTQSVAVGDIDGDGKLDIVVAEPIAQAVGVLLGNGDGTFADEIRYAVKADSLALGDVNNDGRLDVVTAAYEYWVVVLLGSCR
jgi:hypothetical protein